MDRRLKAKKSERKRRIYGRTRPSALLKHHIPVKTDRWDVTPPGFSEIDLVAHCGNSGEGEFAHSLKLTDIQSGWTETRALSGKGQVALQQWERYDSSAAVETINDLYRHELRLWLNLYLPSVKLVKKVRVGSKLRRVYDAAQAPRERVLASRQANPMQVAALNKRRQSRDPLQLGRVIGQKLERIYGLAHQRLSPQAAQRRSRHETQENRQSRRRNG
jgi:hypothetical protein